MMRFRVVVAGLIAGAGLILGAGATASANTIATFELENVIFDDGGTASGTFSINIDAALVYSASIATTAGSPADAFLGATYDDASASSVTFPDITFFHLVSPSQETVLLLNFGLTDSTDLSSLPVFASLSGNEGIIDIASCGFSLCAQRFITGGSVKTLSVATTPLPAGLPLLTTAVGGIALLGWRRKHKTA